MWEERVHCCPPTAMDGAGREERSRTATPRRCCRAVERRHRGPRDERIDRVRPIIGRKSTAARRLRCQSRERSDLRSISIATSSSCGEVCTSQAKTTNGGSVSTVLPGIVCSSENVCPATLSPNHREHQRPGPRSDRNCEIERRRSESAVYEQINKISAGNDQRDLSRRLESPIQICEGEFRMAQLFDSHLRGCTDGSQQEDEIGEIALHPNAMTAPENCLFAHK